MNTSDQEITDAFETLEWLVAMGATDAVGDAPVDRTVSVTKAPIETKSEAPAASPSPAAQSTIVEAKPQSAPIVVDENAYGAAQNAKTIDELHDALKAFEGCSLKRTANTTVFADGNPDADVMIIGEAPGADEDRAGTPFVGESGELLDRMLKATGWSREKDVYITNVVPWRPLGNRNPNAQEIALCLPFLIRHIELAKPKILILLGSVSAQSVLEVKEGITKVRGKWHDYKNGDETIQAMAMFHPSYLLRQPRQKALAWQDLLEIKSHLGQSPQE
ncbi:MAG: uracil-DNA glycosylase [Sphingomonadales bacterium]|nr:uracil-DNA glycosylase [Sphingomonadales bacterium]